MGKKTKFQWTRDEEHPEGIVHITDRQTWADQKKTTQRLTALATALTKIKLEKLNQLPLQPELRECLEAAILMRNKGGIRGGMRRQMLMVVGTMRQQTPDDLERLMEAASNLLGTTF